MSNTARAALSEADALAIASEVDPKASGFFRKLLARAAQLGADRALREVGGEALEIAKRLAADFDLDFDKLEPSGSGFSQEDFTKAAQRQITRRSVGRADSET